MGRKLRIGNDAAITVEDDFSGGTIIAGCDGLEVGAGGQETVDVRTMSDEHAGALLEVIEVLPDHELAALDHDYLVGNRVEIAGRTRRENEEPAGAPTRRGLRCQGTDFLVEALARRLVERSLNLIEERDGRARCERDPMRMAI
mgnify:CR=1 FL=1